MEKQKEPIFPVFILKIGPIPADHGKRFYATGHPELKVIPVRTA